MADQQLLAKPEAPAVAALKDTAVSADDPRAPELMERSVSMDIREERDDLKRAAEQSLNAIMDLNLDGTVRWMSPTFQEITGIPAESMVGKPIVDYIRDNKSIFADSVESIRKDDSKSRIIRFAVECLTPKPPDELPTVHVDSTDGGEQPTTPDDEEPEKVVLEAQGIMVYDRSTSEESHVGDTILSVSKVTDLYTDHVDDQTRNSTRNHHRPSGDSCRVAGHRSSCPCPVSQ